MSHSSEQTCRRHCESLRQCPGPAVDPAQSQHTGLDRGRVQTENIAFSLQQNRVGGGRCIRRSLFMAQLTSLIATNTRTTSR